MQMSTVNAFATSEQPIVELRVAAVLSDTYRSTQVFSVLQVVAWAPFVWLLIDKSF